MFPDPPPVDATTNCSESGVIGPVVGVIGCMQATEIIKIAATGTCEFSIMLLEIFLYFISLDERQFHFF